MSKKDICINCEKEECICTDVPQEVKDKLEQSVKEAKEKEAKLKEVKKDIKDAEKAMQKLNKKLQKLLDDYNKEAGEKSIIVFTSVDSKGITKRSISATEGLNQIDELYLSNAVAGFVLNNFK